jgi:hypothetical protein
MPRAVREFLRLRSRRLDGEVDQQESIDHVAEHDGAGLAHPSAGAGRDPDGRHRGPARSW